MSRPFTAITPFGKLLEDGEIDPDEPAHDLDITRAYVLMLASGAATPKLLLAWRIQKWAEKHGGEVLMQSWVPFARGGRA